MSIISVPESKKLDPRVIRTRQQLREALVALILEHGYDEISIQAITDQAGLRRATFYLHYRDKDELLLSMLRDTLDDLMHQMAALSPKAFTPDTQRVEDELVFRHVQEHADLYRAILSGQGTAEITRGIRDFVAGRIREHYSQIYPEQAMSIPLEV